MCVRVYAHMCVQTEEEGYIVYLPLSLSVVLLKAGSLREAGPN